MNVKKNNVNTKIMVLAALFAAIIYITTLIHLNTGLNGGYIHLGDTFIYLAACILPMPYAMAAASIGAGLSDLTLGAVAYIIPTVIIKSILVLFFTRYHKKFINKRNLIALFLAGVTGLVGYYIATAIMIGNFLAPLTTILVDAAQPVGSAILFVIIAKIFDRTNIKNYIENIM